MYQRPFPYQDSGRAPSAGVTAQALPFIRRVYSLFAGGIALAIVGGLVALYAGQPVPVDLGQGGVVGLPPLVAFGVQHWIIMMVGYFAAFLAASFLRRRPGINVAALLGYGFVTGVFVAP